MHTCEYIHNYIAVDAQTANICNVYVHSCKNIVPVAILKCLPTVNAWIIPGYVSTKYIQYLLYE